MPVSPRVFHYLSFSLNGVNTINQYWRTSDTIPTLFRDPVSGKIQLVGGVPARPGIDFKDPNAGKISAADLLKSNDADLPDRPDIQPKAPAAGGLVDLGKEVSAD